MKLKQSLTLSIILLMSSIQAKAGLIVPTDLNPGDVYHVIFASSTLRDATSTDIADYDTHVTNAAIAAGLNSVSWLAMASTATVNVQDHIDGLWTNLNAEPIYNQNGDRIADSFNDLWANNSILAPIGYDENGTALPASGGGQHAWAGFFRTGVTISPLGIGSPSQVDTSRSDFGWASNGVTTITNTRGVLGISGAITVAPVPIPAAVWLMGSALVGLFGFKRKTV